MVLPKLLQSRETNCSALLHSFHTNIGGSQLLQMILFYSLSDKGEVNHFYVYYRVFQDLMVHQVAMVLGEARYCFTSIC